MQPCLEYKRSSIQFEVQVKNALLKYSMVKSLMGLTCKKYIFIFISIIRLQKFWTNRLPAVTIFNSPSLNYLNYNRKLLIFYYIYIYMCVCVCVCVCECACAHNKWNWKQTVFLITITIIIIIFQGIISSLNWTCYDEDSAFTLEAFHRAQQENICRIM